MMAHWIRKSVNGHLSLESALIVFHHVLGCHDGTNLANVVIDLLNHINITKKVGAPSQSGMKHSAHS